VSARPLLLDLFCKAGGSARGYMDEGFDVVGVDIEPQPRFPGHFIRAEALAFAREHGWEFDAIHAGPPCQVNLLGLKAANRKLGRAYAHPDLIEPTRAVLRGLGLPYVIENPQQGARLISPVVLCGTSFGLPLRRHRQFESNVPLTGLPCEHGRFTEKKYWTSWMPKGKRTRATTVQVYGCAGEKHLWAGAMGIDWMTDEELSQAIPPAYTRHIGHQLLRVVEARKAA